MRGVFGVVSLLVVLAVVGMLGVRQMRATGQGVGAVLPAEARAASGAEAGAASVVEAPLREQAQQLQQRVQSDVSRALEQGAAARKEAAEQ